MSFKYFLIVICFYLLLVSAALAEVPQMINYQGKITTPQGALIDTTISMTFAIYADSIDTDSLWSETQSSIVVEKGIFSVLLGSVNSIPDSVFTGSLRYLGVKAGDDPEMIPRKPIVSVGYAYNSDMLDGYSSEAFLPPMIPINKVVRGMIYIAPDDPEETQTLSSQVDPDKSVVILNDRAQLFVVKSLTTSEITLRHWQSSSAGPHYIEYQIIEYK